MQNDIRMNVLFRMITVGIISTFLFSNCDKGGDLEMNPTSPNILLIIADDMGKDATNGFPEGLQKPNTPNIDGIKNSGITFNNCWVNPTCSPTRASIITGKYGYRTGVKWANDDLNPSEKILHQYIKEETNNTYSTATIGKWHLSGNTINPEIFGMDYYAGIIRGAIQDYYQWQLYENGETSQETVYATEKLTDLSIEWINDQNSPWFLWLAYNAAHTPFHVPPTEMHRQGNLPEFIDGMDEAPYYFAAIEAMDYQIGKLLDSMTEEEKDNTVIFFIGDNGTPNQVAQSPYSFVKAKGSLYQGGINTPLFVSGANVSRRGITDNNLINSTDLFATIAELAGLNLSEIHDSQSFKSLLTTTNTIRNFQYAEKKVDDDDLWAISNGEYKLIVNANGNEEMYNLNDDPYENNNLLDLILNNTQLQAKLELENELLEIRN